jgi:hypothetical protein
MRIGDAVRTLRGWSSIKLASMKLRPFSDARKQMATTLAAIKDNEPCMWKIEVYFPPKRQP